MTSTKLVEKRGPIDIGMPQRGIFIFIGLPKSGKTTLIASAENSYVIECEPRGANRISGRIHDVKDLAEFRQVIKEAANDPKIKIVGVDSIDVISDWFEKEVANAAGLEKMTDKKTGVDGWSLWAELKERLEGLVEFMRDSGKLFLIVAHTKDPKLDASGHVVIPSGLNVPGKGATFLSAQADAIGNCGKRQVANKTEYFVSFQGGPLGIYGSRIRELEDKTIVLPSDNPWSAIEAVFQKSKTNGGK